MDPLCIQSLIFTQWPCQWYLEACLWYSDFQQEHLKLNAKCFLLNYPNTAVWVMSWNFSPFTLRVFYIISCHWYRALLVLGKDIPLKYVFKHIFLSIVLVKSDNHIFLSIVWFNLSCDLWGLSSNILLLLKTPRCTILSVRPCYFCWWHSGNHRWTRTLPNGPPRSTSGKMVLFVPRPWYRRCYRHNWQVILWHALLS